MNENTTPKRMLRCRKSLQYVRDDGWTWDPDKAQSFANVIDALRMCLEKNLQNVDLVLQLPDAHGELFCARIR